MLRRSSIFSVANPRWPSSVGTRRVAPNIVLYRREEPGKAAAQFCTATFCARSRPPHSEDSSYSWRYKADRGAGTWVGDQAQKQAREIRQTPEGGAAARERGACRQWLRRQTFCGSSTDRSLFTQSSTRMRPCTTRRTQSLRRSSRCWATSWQSCARSAFVPLSCFRGTHVWALHQASFRLIAPVTAVADTVSDARGE